MKKNSFMAGFTKSVLSSLVIVAITIALYIADNPSYWWRPCLDGCHASNIVNGRPCLNVCIIFLLSVFFFVAFRGMIIGMNDKDDWTEGRFPVKRLIGYIIGLLGIGITVILILSWLVDTMWRYGIIFPE